MSINETQNEIKEKKEKKVLFQLVCHINIKLIISRTVLYACMLVYGLQRKLFHCLRKMC